MFSIGADCVSKKENFDRLLGELEILLESRERISTACSTKTKSISSSRGCASAASTLIRPKPTDANRFTSASSSDERFAEQKCCQLLERSTFERNSIPKMFKPIRSPGSPQAGFEIDVLPEEKTDREREALPSRDRDSDSKRKRRSSLPCFEKTEQFSEPISAADARISETYDVSYYSSDVQGKKEETKTDYYSCFSDGDPCADRGTAQLIPFGLKLKSASDECVYDTRDGYAETISTSGILSDRIAEKFYLDGTENSKYRRISVTEPSSPAQGSLNDYSPCLPCPDSTDEIGKVSTEKDLESDVSDMESESSAVVSRIKKSKSFVVSRCGDDSGTGFFQTKKTKTCKLKIRKPSASCTSSSDEPCGRFKPQSENVTPSKKMRPSKKTCCSSAHRLDNVRRQKPARFSTLDRLPRDKHARQASVGEAEKPTEYRPVERERAKSWNRESDKKHAFPSSEIDPDVYLVLLEILTRRSRGMPEKSVPDPDLWSKSLPRNHKSRFQKHVENSSAEISRRLKCDQDCLKILRSVSKEKPQEEVSRPKRQAENKSIVSHSQVEIVATGPQTESAKLRGKFSDRDAFLSTPQQTYLIETAKSKTEIFHEDQETSANKRSLSRDKFKTSNKAKEGCVLRIEDGNLWIEICKAIQETEAKDKKFKKTVYQT